jgi:hypothetical protein
MNKTAENYQRAWDKIFGSYPTWKQNEINRFVKSGQINNRFYSAFIDEVIAEAESYENVQK